MSYDLDECNGKLEVGQPDREIIIKYSKALGGKGGLVIEDDWTRRLRKALKARGGGHYSAGATSTLLHQCLADERGLNVIKYIIKYNITFDGEAAEGMLLAAAKLREGDAVVKYMIESRMSFSDEEVAAALLEVIKQGLAPGMTVELMLEASHLHISKDAVNAAIVQTAKTKSNLSVHCFELLVNSHKNIGSKSQAINKAFVEAASQIDKASLAQHIYGCYSEYIPSKVIDDALLRATRAVNTTFVSFLLGVNAFSTDVFDTQVIMNVHAAAIETNNEEMLLIVLRCCTSYHSGGVLGRLYERYENNGALTGTIMSFMSDSDLRIFSSLKLM